MVFSFFFFFDRAGGGLMLVCRGDGGPDLSFKLAEDML